MTLKLSATALLFSTGLMAGCASSPIGSTVQTASVDPNAPKMAAAKPDPTCVALLAKIDGIRKDGVTERAEQAALGKSTTVPVKRASLGQLAELSKANAEYQSKCSAPGLKSAYVAPAAAPVAAAAPTAEKTEKAVTKAATKPVAAAKPVEAKPVAAAVTAPSAAPAAAPVVPPVVQAAAPAVVAPTVATPAVAVPNPATAAVQAAKQAATQAATSAAAQVTPMPSIPGVSVAGQ